MSNIFLCRLVFELYKKCLDKDDWNKDAYIEYVLCSQIARMKNVKKIVFQTSGDGDTIILWKDVRRLNLIEMLWMVEIDY